jgi:serine/threonine-protein kinase PRP4
LAKQGDEETSNLQAQEASTNQGQILAADYDPSMDRREDEQKRVNGPIDPNAMSVDQVEEAEYEEVEEVEDLDDMFAVGNAERKVKVVKKVKRSVSL